VWHCDFLAQFCVEQGGEEGYDILLSTILKVIAALLVDPKQEVSRFLVLLY
jgi:hypothetical protein